MKALHKDFWMEIRKSKARFISIFLIVALGVAFFSGIQAASPDMRFSGDAYYDESRLMDLKVVGTLGLTEEDVEALKKIEGVESAEGAYGTDVICGEGEDQKVLHVESLNKSVNQIKVQKGKIPEKKGEIFLDREYALARGYEVNRRKRDFSWKKIILFAESVQALFIFRLTGEIQPLAPVKSVVLPMWPRKILIRRFTHRFIFVFMALKILRVIQMLTTI